MKIQISNELPQKIADELETRLKERGHEVTRTSKPSENKSKAACVLEADYIVDFSLIEKLTSPKEDKQ